MEEVCFARNDFNLYLFILLCLFAYFTYIHIHRQQEFLTNVNLHKGLSREELETKLRELQDRLYNTQLGEQTCRRELAQTKDSNEKTLLNRIYNPLVGPTRLYPGGRLNTSRVSSYQMMGFLYNGNERFPLFGRQKWPGKSDKWEYYAIDETRNRLKLPFTSKNDNELYDGDIISIPGVGNDYTVKIYEYDQFRYNPEM
jgi:hypothetical protein